MLTVRVPAVPRARSVEVSDELRRLDSLADPDFVYACAIPSETDTDRTAEQWARSVFEDMPRLLQALVLFGWVTVLRLRLAPRSSPSHVLGWSLLSATPTVAVLAVKSPFLSAHLLVRVAHDEVAHVTFVRYDRPPARVLWMLATPLHRIVIPYCLRRAARQGS
jgi:hypothetical protein